MNRHPDLALVFAAAVSAFLLASAALLGFWMIVGGLATLWRRWQGHRARHPSARDLADFAADLADTDIAHLEPLLAINRINPKE